MDYTQRKQNEAAERVNIKPDNALNNRHQIQYLYQLLGNLHKAIL